MNSIKKLKESMGCNTIRDDHGGGIIYQRVHMDKAEFDEMLAEVEEEYSGLQAKNAKLREICADMLTCINAYKARKSICWECEHHRDVDELRSACFLGSDARNLGIEVSE